MLDASNSIEQLKQLRLKFIKIKNIASTLTGFAFDSTKFNNNNNGFPIIRIRDLKQSSTHTFYNGKYDQRYVIKRGDLLIGMDGEFNLAEWVSNEALLNQRVCKLIVDESKADKTYIKYALPKKLKEIEDATPFVTVKHLSNKQVLEIEIPLPDLQTQKQIAAILEDADRARQQRKAANILTEQFLQSSFLHIFGDPMINEKGWEVMKIGLLLEFITSGSRGWAQYYADEGDIFLRINNVGYSKLTLEDMIYVNAPDTAESKRTALQSGDVLFSITADLGRTAVIPEGFPKAFINQHLAVLRLKKDIVNPTFLSYFFATKSGRSQIINKGGVKLGLNFDDIKALQIYLPPLPLQQHFASLLANVEILRQKQQESERELEHLFQALLQRYFDAEVKSVIQASSMPLSLAAEPSENYKAIASSIPENKKGFAKYVLAGKIIKECRNTSEFTHIKFQKLQHLTEYLLEEELEQNFYYQAAGPYDNKLMHNLAPKMQQLKWFTEDFYVFNPLDKASEIDGHFNRYFGSKKPVFDKLLQLLGNSTEDECEIISTLFAIWNDMLIQKEAVSDTEIIKRFYQWSDRKKKYNQDQLLNALQWMREVKIGPIGFGPVIKHKKS